MIGISSKVLWSALLLSLAGLVGCAAAPSKGEETSVPGDGKYDSFRAPTEHGRIDTTGGVVSGILSEDAQFHAWEFYLSQDAKITLATERPVAGGTGDEGDVDTVLYLYKRNDEGGFGRYIARNDDSDSPPFSRIERNLEEGVYRVLVKGYGDTDLGPFLLTAACNGNGCADEREPTSCLFGDDYGDLDHSPNLETVRKESFSGGGLDGLLAEQLVATLRHHDYDDVTTVEQAFESIDGGDLNLMVLRDPRTGKQYHSFEYGLGDNSYGAVTYAENTEIAVSIGDGDLGECREEEPAGLHDNITITRGSVPRALASFRTIRAGQLAGLDAGDDLPPSQVHRLLALANTNLGESCDGVPSDPDVYLQDVGAGNMIGFLESAYGIAEWRDRPTAEQIEALGNYFGKQEQDGYTSYDDAEDFQVLDAELLQRQGCDATEGHFFFVHRRSTHEVFYLVLRNF